MIQVDRYEIIVEESKVFDGVCFIKDCNNVAVILARSGINEDFDLAIPVCETCLPKISSWFDKKSENSDNTQRPKCQLS